MYSRKQNVIVKGLCLCSKFMMEWNRTVHLFVIVGGLVFRWSVWCGHKIGDIWFAKVQYLPFAKFVCEGLFSITSDNKKGALQKFLKYQDVLLNITHFTLRQMPIHYVRSVWLYCIQVTTFKFKSEIYLNKNTNCIQIWKKVIFDCNKTLNYAMCLKITKSTYT